MKKRIWMLMMLCALASCALAQDNVAKFLGNLNGAVQIYERYESLYNKVRGMRSVKTSDYGTVVCKPYARSLKSLTWSNLQIERQGPYLYVWEVQNGKFANIGKHALTANGSKTYDAYVLRGEYLYHYTVVVVVMDRKGYVYFKDDDNRTLESYTFDNK